jgi:hypothetical protein
MIKLIASDMDGTLLDENGKINGEFFHVLGKLIDMNIRFAPASGRQYGTLYRDFGNFKDQLVYIAENGTLVLYKGKELYSNPIKDEYIAEIIEDAKKIPYVCLVLCSKDCAYISNNKDYLVDEVKKYYVSYKIIDDFSQIKDPILKIGILDLSGIKRVYEEFFYPRWKDRLQVVISGEFWLDLYNKDANKGNALKLIQEKLGIKKDETMVFGDYFNDVEMLKNAHFSYAMENAPDEVKSHANFIAKSNRDNGVVETIKKIVLGIN